VAGQLIPEHPSPQASSRDLQEEEPAAAPTPPQNAVGQSPLWGHGVCAELHSPKSFPFLAPGEETSQDRSVLHPLGY